LVNKYLYLLVLGEIDSSEEYDISYRTHLSRGPNQKAIPAQGQEENNKSQNTRASSDFGFYCFLAA
jgi:hypothetical protein